jgi:hypothetical protein
MFANRRSDIMKTIHQWIRRWRESTLTRDEKELRNFDSIWRKSLQCSLSLSPGWGAQFPPLLPVIIFRCLLDDATRDFRCHGNANAKLCYATFNAGVVRRENGNLVMTKVSLRQTPKRADFNPFQFPVEIGNVTRSSSETGKQKI